MFGDVLKSRINELKYCSITKNSDNSLWIVLRNIAVADIKSIYPEKVDSDTAIPLYYEILSKNEDYIPKHYCEILKSNNQTRYRVLNRNLWSSNAFNPDGLANQVGIIAEKELNDKKKGCRIVFIGDKNI